MIPESELLKALENAINERTELLKVDKYAYQAGYTLAILRNILNRNPHLKEIIAEDVQYIIKLNAETRQNATS